MIEFRYINGTKLNTKNSKVTTTFSGHIVTSKLAVSNLGSSDVGYYQCSYISPLDKQRKLSKNITLHLYGKSSCYSLDYSFVYTDFRVAFCNEIFVLQYLLAYDETHISIPFVQRSSSLRFQSRA